MPKYSIPDTGHCIVHGPTHTKTQCHICDPERIWCNWHAKDEKSYGCTELRCGGLYCALHGARIKRQQDELLAEAAETMASEPLGSDLWNDAWELVLEIRYAEASCQAR